MLKKFFSLIFLPLYLLYPRDQDHPEMTNDKNDTWHVASPPNCLLLYIYIIRGIQEVLKVAWKCKELLTSAFLSAQQLTFKQPSKSIFFAFLSAKMVQNKEKNR